MRTMAEALAEIYSDRIDRIWCEAHRPFWTGGPKCGCSPRPRQLRPPVSFEDSLRQAVAINYHSITDIEIETASAAEIHGVSLEYAFARLAALPEIVLGYPGVTWGGECSE